MTVKDLSPLQKTFYDNGIKTYWKSDNELILININIEPVKTVKADKTRCRFAANTSNLYTDLRNATYFTDYRIMNIYSVDLTAFKDMKLEYRDGCYYLGDTFRFTKQPNQFNNIYVQCSSQKFLDENVTYHGCIEYKIIVMYQEAFDHRFHRLSDKWLFKKFYGLIVDEVDKLDRTIYIININSAIIGRFRRHLSNLLIENHVDVHMVLKYWEDKWRDTVYK